MRHRSGLGNMKRRMKTCSSDVKASSKASTGRRREITNRKRHKSDKTDPTSCSHIPGIPLSDKLSLISCECQRAPNRTRCTASPLPQEEPEGKENEERRRRSGGCRASCLLESGEDQEMGAGEDDVGGPGGGGAESLFPDDDSNQILPVEQFFGNLEAMQDGLPTAASGTGTSLRAPRGENQQRRRRHYFARVDSEEEEEEEEEEEQLSDGDMQLSHPGDS
ncbi:UPF0688 protein C1orf174 homolog isoform X1 [Gadus chalcogrammus]|uniref:UPF0688 protein C1orf174 homolog isoform X1 n=2 Tax=Gadus chalcogrammus TaxID=1042646 RepID=UPI0024C3F21F|nr:UPF0688 protein C1orf174 homolog isoform X1 [Gadus chalcogrammus]